MEQVYVFDWKTFFSVIVPLIVLIVSPFLTLHIARKQIRATILSGEKKDWINTLRNDLATFTSKTFYMQILLFQLHELKKDDNVEIVKLDDLNKVVQNYFEESMHLLIKIKLMLDIKNNSHKELDKHIETIIDALNITTSDTERDYSELGDKIEELMPLSRKIFEESYTSIHQLK